MPASIRPDHGRFQILSLDGGGIRGVFGAAALAAIEEDCGVNVADCFDLIAGTSTGGIIAIALGLGIRPKTIVELYVRYGPRIFANGWGLRSFLHWFRPKYPSARLERVLRTVFGDRRFGESRKRLLVPSFNLDDNDVYTFRTPHVDHLRRDSRELAWKVAMATTAAPTFFGAYRGIGGLRLVDGSVWANNPSMLAVTEAVGALGVHVEAIRMLSIGTVAPVRVWREELTGGGMLAWAGNAAALVVAASSIAATNEARFFLGDRLLRVDAVAREATLALDGLASVDDLITRAQASSRRQMAEISAKFMTHRAPEYVPAHLDDGSAVSDAGESRGAA